MEAIGKWPHFGWLTDPPSGVDLGSNKAVMAVVKKGGIDIVLNDSSGRATP